MSKFSNLLNWRNIADQSIRYQELDTDLQAKVDQITVNKTDIEAILASKAAANGIATLGADGKLLASQVPSIALTDFLGEVADTTALYALGGQRGDWAIVVPTGNAANGQSYMRIGEGNTANDWRAISTPLDGVTSLRNSSGSVTGQNGVVTLADVAFSGSANDVTFSGNGYNSTNVHDALVEVMQSVDGVSTDVSNLQTAVGAKVDLAGITPYLSLTGTINGTNKTFTSATSLTGAKVIVMVGGQVVRPDDYTISGNDVVFNTMTPDYEYQRPAVSIFKAAA